MRGTVRRPKARAARLERMIAPRALAPEDASGTWGLSPSCAAPAATRRAATTTGRPLGLATLLAILAAPAAAWALDVRGTLQVPSDLVPLAPAPTDAERARARYWEEWNGVLDPRPARVDAARELAVVLTGSGAASEGEQPPFRIHNGSLWPATIVARAGTAISIRNEDGIAYELFAEGNAELGPIQTAPGNARPVTLTAPGNWPLRDRVHPHVRGHLHALADLVARAFVERDASYTFRGVAPGTYRLRVLHGARELASQDVNVPEGGTLNVPPISLAARAASPAAPHPATPPATP